MTATAVQTKAAPMPTRQWTEGQFQAWVVANARQAGFRVHVSMKRMRKASLVNDPDWPDLEMLRVDDRRHVFAELKAHGGRLSEGQREVIAALEHIHDGTQEVYVWSPDDAPAILDILFGPSA